MLPRSRVTNKADSQAEKVRKMFGLLTVVGNWFFEIKKGKKEGMKRRMYQTHRLIELGRALKVIDSRGHILQVRS